MTEPDPRYRPCVGVLVLNDAGRVFIGRRVPKDNPEHLAGAPEWQMPQGGIDPGEDPGAAALRELYEETSIRSVRLLSAPPQWLSYDLPPELAGRSWGGRWRGQTQRWFAYRFEGDESEIEIAAPGGGAHKPEFVEWRWEDPEALPGLIVPFKRSVYERVVALFRPLWG